ncbi:MAG: preprotein translocase subunit SecE [Firmicutes bacterium]|nr:preprotein translocase subunit SecE [Clostridiales bacterium]MBQ3122588.1 preprotein translocase subunit SecE [Bacillota bacterium]MBQ9972246.1 preprotein translocase subunit SecE [Bacillota bacterium]
MADNKKKAQTPATEQRGLRAYFRGIRTELKKVVWPTKKELGSFTAVVIATCFIFALVFWGLDSAVLAMLRGILNISI